MICGVHNLKAALVASGARCDVDKNKTIATMFITARPACIRKKKKKKKNGCLACLEPPDYFMCDSPAYCVSTIIRNGDCRLVTPLPSNLFSSGYANRDHGEKSSLVR